MDAIPLLKVIVAGDGNVGKTSLVRRFCEGRFETSRIMTIGVDFQTKVVTLPEATVKLSIWDIAGQERFSVIRTGFYRGSLAAALVYDLTAPETLKNLVTWYFEITKVIKDQKFVVVGNKADLATDETDRIGLQFAKVIHADYVRTSAATGDGVPLMFETLARLAITSQKPAQS
jgi:small GTP-binding protein